MCNQRIRGFSDVKSWGNKFIEAKCFFTTYEPNVFVNKLYFVNRLFLSLN